MDVLRHSSCAFGVFDGVHKGHCYIIGRAIAAAKERGGRSVVLTFDRDPDELFRPDKLKKLLSNEDRLKALATTGVDAVAVLRFTRDFAALEPEVFLDSTFDRALPASIHVGCDFAYGARAAGSLADLKRWGSAHGVDVDGYDLVSEDGAPITATRIRGLLATGDVAEANELLGRPYRVHGTVREGRGEGRDLGFRTANLVVSPQMRALGDGVYAAWAEVEGARYKAAVSVGIAPTFADEATATMEIHLLDFDRNIYGQDIAVDFMEWLRPMMKFSSTEELVSTVMGNIAWVRENL
jgi:riboflavin kinase/FMN adenylyltransferase